MLGQSKTNVKLNDLRSHLQERGVVRLGVARLLKLAGIRRVSISHSRCQQQLHISSFLVCQWVWRAVNVDCECGCHCDCAWYAAQLCANLLVYKYLYIEMQCESMSCRSSVKEKLLVFPASLCSLSLSRSLLLCVCHSLWHSHTNSHRLRANVPQCNRAARNWICCKLLPLSRGSVARVATVVSVESQATQAIRLLCSQVYRLVEQKLFSLQCCTIFN